jgi:hypothetical protein
MFSLSRCRAARHYHFSEMSIASKGLQNHLFSCITDYFKRHWLRQRYRKAAL